MTLPDPEEHALVLKAIALRVSGCCNWHPSALERVLNDPEIRSMGLTPEGIPDLLADHVDAGKPVSQKRQDEEWKWHSRWWYGASVGITGYHKRLFVKLILRDEDSDYPMVEIVSCHF